MRAAFLAPSVALLLAIGASGSQAAAPTDPAPAGSQPLTIMRVGEALDHIGPALQDVPVLVADTGMNLQQPDLAPRLFSMPTATPAPAPEGGNPGTIQQGAAGWDLIGSADAPGPLMPDGDPSDDAPSGGHGTAVAGVLGAAWNNGIGGAGVAPNARFLALRTCWPDDQCYAYVQASAINWAADRGVRVVSMSWLSDPNIEADLANAIASHPNVLFVAIPSGNGEPGCDADGQQGAAGTCSDVSAQTPAMPCAMKVPNVLCVSTSSPADGTDCGAVGASSVDVAVPTENNTTTFRDGSFGGTGCATSYASPAAAGLATILFGIDPTASASDVRQAIIDGARKVPAWSGKSVSGGIADAVGAVDAFQTMRGIAGRTPEVSGGGAPTPAPVTTPDTQQADTTRPVITLTISPTSFRAGGRALGISRARGAKLRVGLSEDARVTITFAKLHARRNAGSFSGRFAQGVTRLNFPATGRGGKRLAAGRYRVVANATDYSGNKARAVAAVFRVLPG